jgi:adenylate kinase family enzyme
VNDTENGGNSKIALCIVNLVSLIMRIIILGNAGAGKTTMARDLIGDSNIPCLSLDEIAWTPNIQRKPLADSISELHQFIDASDRWVIEGCYGDLVEAALPYCTKLLFLNPGLEVCVRRCQNRPWEPDKFRSLSEQQAMLKSLIQWVREYETRDDEYGLQRHRQIFSSFTGRKQEYVN